MKWNDKSNHVIIGKWEDEEVEAEGEGGGGEEGGGGIRRVDLENMGVWNGQWLGTVGLKVPAHGYERVNTKGDRSGN